MGKGVIYMVLRRLLTRDERGPRRTRRQRLAEILAGLVHPTNKSGNNASTR